MKLTVVAIVLSAALAGCEGPADLLAREKREAIDKTCQRQADKYADDQTDKELQDMAKELQETVPETKESMRDQAKRECVTASILSDR